MVSGLRTIREEEVPLLRAHKQFGANKTSKPARSRETRSLTPFPVTDYDHSRGTFYTSLLH